MEISHTERDTERERTQDLPRRASCGATDNDVKTRRAMAEWDCSCPTDNVDWYKEYIARQGPLSMDWLPQPTGCGVRAKEVRGLGLFEAFGETRILAPSENGSVCWWNLDLSSSHPRTRRKAVCSKPGLISPTHDKYNRGHGAGVVECVSVDSRIQTAYFAVRNALCTVDLRTMQLISKEQYRGNITALSSATHPTPTSMIHAFQTPTTNKTAMHPHDSITTC